MQKLIPYAFLVVGLLLCALAVPAQIDTLQTAAELDNYEATDAIVLRLFTKEHRRGPSTEVLEFEYEVDGETYEGSNAATRFQDEREELEALVRRDENKLRHVTVYYDPDNPERSVIHRDIDKTIPWGIIGFSVLLVILGLHGVWSFRREKRRHEAEMERRRRIREQRRRE
ncbi:MAG: DUF3592 domain-containing protein [Myxococcota bacterium]